MKVWMCAALLMFAGLKPGATLTAVAQGSRPTSDVAQGLSPANHTLTAVRGIKVGHHTLSERPTGCTVVLIESGATAGVDVRGAAPATRDTDLLNPSKMVEQIFGIALSGGSHTMVDGDTVFAVATGTQAGEPDMIALGALAADVMATAVIRAATQATGLPNLPAVHDLK